MSICGYAALACCAKYPLNGLCVRSDPIARSSGPAHVAAMCRRTSTMPIPMHALGCVASLAFSHCLWPSTRRLTAFWVAATPSSTACWLCGTVNFSVAAARPSTVPIACALRPALPVGSALACRSCAVRCASAVVSAQHSRAPSSPPRTGGRATCLAACSAAPSRCRACS